MASSSSGKSVARAAATGGGRTYRGQRPLNWYAGLALIVILGIGSIVIARIDYQKGPATTAAHYRNNLAHRFRLRSLRHH